MIVTFVICIILLFSSVLFFPSLNLRTVNVGEGSAVFIKDNCVVYQNQTVHNYYIYNIETEEILNTHLNGSVIDFDFPWLVASQKWPVWKYIYYNVETDESVECNSGNRYFPCNCISNGYIAFSGSTVYDDSIYANATYFNTELLGNTTYTEHIGIYNCQTNETKYIGHGFEPKIKEDIVYWTYLRNICYYYLSNNTGYWFNSELYPEMQTLDVVSNNIVYTSGDVIRKFDLKSCKDVLITANASYVKSYDNLVLCYNDSTNQYFIYDVLNDSITVCEKLWAAGCTNIGFYGNYIITNDWIDMMFDSPNPVGLPNIMIYDIQNQTLYEPKIVGRLEDYYSPFCGKSILIDSPESSVGEDINQDGDKSDNIVRIVIIEDNSMTHRLNQPPFIVACTISLILIVAVAIWIRKR